MMWFVHVHVEVHQKLIWMCACGSRHCCGCIVVDVLLWQCVAMTTCCYDSCVIISVTQRKKTRKGWRDGGPLWGRGPDARPWRRTCWTCRKRRRARVKRWGHVTSDDGSCDLIWLVFSVIWLSLDVCSRRSCDSDDGSCDLMWLVFSLIWLSHDFCSRRSMRSTVTLKMSWDLDSSLSLYESECV